MSREDVGNFSEQYLSLTTSTSEKRFQEIVNKLLGSNFIIYIKNDDRSDYTFIKDHKLLFSSLFSSIGFELVHNEEYSYFYIKSVLDNYANRYLFKKDELIMLCILKKIYLEEIEKGNLDTIPHTTLKVIKTNFEAAKNIDSLKKTNLIDMLRLYKRRKIIDFYKDLNDGDDSDIVIYHTINEIINSKNLDELIESLENNDLNVEDTKEEN